MTSCRIKFIEIMVPGGRNGPQQVKPFLAHLDEVEMSLCYTLGVRVPVRLKFLG
jgi:hypothetical protein